MKAVPFIDTMLNDQYRVFVLQIFDHVKIPDIFKDWNSKDMVGWTKLTNRDNDISIEFYGMGNKYKISNPNLVGEKTTSIPYPQNLDQFICDCSRNLVDLQWEDSIISSLENRIYFMNQNEIKNNVIDLLTKIEKT